MIVLPSTRGVLHKVSATDAAFATVVHLAHFDGANGSTTFTNSCAKGDTLTPGGGDTISTAQSVFGGASMRRNTSTPPTTGGNHADYRFGTNDFTIEFRYRPDTVALAIIFDMRANGVNNASIPTIYNLGDGTLIYYNQLTDRITSSTGVIQAATWHAIAVSRVSGTTRMFVNGTQVGSSYADSVDYNDTGTRIWLGSYVASAVDAYYDELRLSNGLYGAGAGRYSGNYTPDTAAFPNS